MIRLVILALAIYGLYMLFFQKKKITPEHESRKNQRPGDYTDYEEIK
jgi:flagellar basal body-associated protein FliL